MGGLSHRFAVKVFHRVIKIFTADVRAKISQYFQFQRIVITITVSVISRICIKIAQSVQKPFAVRFDLQTAVLRQELEHRSMIMAVQ